VILITAKAFTRPKHITTPNTYSKKKEEEAKMAEKNDKEHVHELKEMIQQKQPKEPVEKVLAMFCERHGISMDACRKYYKSLVEKGEVKKE
jgi:hypothetical protein